MKQLEMWALDLSLDAPGQQNHFAGTFNASLVFEADCRTAVCAMGTGAPCTSLQTPTVPGAREIVLWT